MIWGFGKPEYFFKRDWTTQITLIRLEKLDFTRESAETCGKAMRPDRADGSVCRSQSGICDKMFAKARQADRVYFGSQHIV